MIRYVIVAVLAAVFLAAPRASADVLHLKNGGRVEGVVRRVGDHYHVETLCGSARIKASEVRHHQVIPYVTEVYENRREAMDAADPNDHYRLAMWCRGKNLLELCERHLERALVLDPDHARSRAFRREVKVGGVWMTRDAARELSLAKAGFIRYEGRLFTEDGLAAYLDAKRQQLDLEAEAEVKRAAREAAERKAREEEERIAKLAAERKAIEEAAKRAEEDRLALERLIEQNRELIELLREEQRLRARSWSWWPYGGDAYRGTGHSVRRRFGPRYRSTGLGSALRFRFHRGNLHIEGVVR